MGTYDFDEIIDRRGTDCVKWDDENSQGVLPMWVADMDFAAAPQIQRAMEKRLTHPVYGYTETSDALYEAIVSWVGRRYHWDIKKGWITFSPGVVPILSMSILALTVPGDRILTMTPVYPPFYHVIQDNGRVVVESPLIRDEKGCYTIDFENLEASIDSRTKMMLLCNPHNPAGRVWSQEELLRLSDIAKRHDLTVVSDEIHADFIYSGHRHIPIASLSEDMKLRTITAYAPSKTFNLAGLCQSYAVIPNPRLMAAFTAVHDTLHLNSNIFGLTALKAAYNEAEDWLDELLPYLEANRDFVISYIKEHIPQIQVCPSEGTYLLWLDCRGLGLKNITPARFFHDTAKVRLNTGSPFGVQAEEFIRLNIGCPRGILKEGLKRIERAVKELSDSRQ